ncbi:MAG TPA: hypothetical protein VMV61_03950 [Patescibacteria group bacterium]|nr:hypothetical protein [Patescibacteria group bacterium]
MSSAFLFGVMFVAAVWAIGGYFIWEFGPGDRVRSVRCPVLKKRATILACLKERNFAGSYAGLRIADVQLCSLLESTHLACHKDCIHPGPRQAAAN